MKSKILVLILSACTFSMAHATNEQLKDEKAKVEADKTQVNSACSADAQTAGCGGQVVGEGLLKCMHAYKKEHKDFKFSEGCKTAMKQLRGDRAELKSERAEMKAEKAQEKSEKK